MSKLGISADRALRFVRDSYDLGYVLWYVESVYPSEVAPRLREWKSLLGAAVNERERKPVPGEAHPTAVAASVPWTGESQVILMATAGARRSDVGVVWRPYQWMEGLVKIGPYEMVSQNAANLRSVGWRLAPPRRSMIEGSIRNALETGNERMLRASSGLVEMLPRVDGIQGPFRRMLDDGTNEWATRHGTPWPLARTSPTEMRSLSPASSLSPIDAGMGVFKG